ncbi:dual specificity protein kinase CLK1-like [Cuculus canorus]|uniref:dual specificity protein kinase CLK1-like n=1 Tax=Cuculus canorus TaxID=55661 RepID=UPI0023AB0850|nr:dual specificity protein kinase CLK1-like [Cuculus canorus]
MRMVHVTKQEISEPVSQRSVLLHCHVGSQRRVEVLAVLGEGGFSKVVECIDHGAYEVCLTFSQRVSSVRNRAYGVITTQQSDLKVLIVLNSLKTCLFREGRHVAVKIAKNFDWSSDAACEEIQVLEDLEASDPSNAYHCVQMLGWFEHRGHVCIVFELLGLSTFDFMSVNDFLPFNLDDIRHMAYQICTSVNFLHMKKLTHTDLKPDNIVFVKSDYVEEYNPKLVSCHPLPHSPPPQSSSAFIWSLASHHLSFQECTECRLRKPDIRLVDFGCATYDHDYHNPVVTTRPYRAPEVVLELGWSHPCDVWSIGCTLLEYYLGDLVFEPDDDIVHLAMMERLLGPLPDQMIKRVVSSKKKYFCNGRLAWDERSASGQYVSGCCKPLKVRLQGGRYFWAEELQVQF